MSAKEDLEDRWRWQYDILVYPKESLEFQGLGDGWIAPQTSIASYGGISIDEWELIREIPGVKVAAPLSILGYFDYDTSTAYLDNAERGEVYEIEYEKRAYDGLRDIRLMNTIAYREYIKENEYEQMPLVGVSDKNISFSKTNVPPNEIIRTQNQMLLVAVDPETEELLYRLSDSVVEGDDLFLAEVMSKMEFPVLPIIALRDQGLQVEETVRISRVELSEDIKSLEVSNDSLLLLMNSPKILLANLSINPYSPDLRYKNMKLYFDQNGITNEESYIHSFSWREWTRYAPLHFQLKKEEENEIPILFVKGEEKRENYYLGEQDRVYVYREMLEFIEDFTFAVDIIGYYDTNLIKPQYATSWKLGDPIDLYTPQNSMILADGAGNPVDPRPLIPLPMKDAYYTGAPDALTTLDAAKIFYGDDPPISSIRVVVSGVEERSEESQRKIEQIATEIMEKTGHNVEIMLGSSAGKVHIQLGGAGEGEIGLVEEGWQKKGVSWEIEEQISVANQWLFIYLAVIIFVLSYTVITHSLLKRSAEFSMLRAIGWSRSKLIRVLLCEIGMLSLIPVIPVFLLMGLWSNTLNWVDGLVLLGVNLLIISIGYYSGTHKALWQSPRAGLAGEGSQGSMKRLFPIHSVLGYVLHQLLRRPLRFGLMLLSLVLSTMMVLLFVATQQSLSDFLFLSFLGEVIDLQLKPYQTGFLILGIVFTVSVVIMLIFLNLAERQKEFYIMRSIGWPIKKVQRYLLIESGVVGVLGGVLGTLAGYALLTYFSTLWLPAWVSALSILFPFILLILFTLILYRFIGSSHFLKRSID